MIAGFLNIKKVLLRTVAVAVAVFLLLPLFTDITTIFAIPHTDNPTHVSYPSLTGIETIKIAATSTDPFKILEIVPQDGTGSMGYYVPGQEPIFQNIQTALTSLQSAVEREAYFRALLDQLEHKGLSSADPNADLIFTEGTYSEFIETPWNTATAPTGSIPITLDHSESKTYKGDYVSTPSGGDFVVTDMYVLAPTPGTGTHSMEKTEFVYNSDVTGDPTDYFYYGVEFVELDSLKTTPPFDTYTYLNIAPDPSRPSVTRPETLSEYLRRMEPSDRVDTTNFPETYIYTVIPDGDSDPSNDRYVFRSKTTDLVTEIPVNETLYVVDPASTLAGPVAWSSDLSATPYAANNSTFTADPSGDYVIEHEFSLVTPGTGTHSFVENDATGTQEYTYTYTEVFISLPYKNNNWFIWDVLNDFDTSAGPFVQVDSVTPAAITNAQISEADLIVFSAGFDINAADPAVTSLESLYADNTNDLDPIRRAEIYDRVTNTNPEEALLPIIIDSRLSNITNSEISGLITQLYNASDRRLDNSGFEHNNGFVDENLYYFVPEVTSAGGAGKLITSSFNSLFSDTLYTNNAGYDDTNSPFIEIHTEIVQENVYRNATGTPLLPVDITMATAIRYIINHSDQRVVQNKAAVNVLQIQPISMEKYNSTVNDPDVINAQYVKDNFLPTDTSLDVGDISINTMGTPEFIGKIEDINEVYDMLYIGADIYSDDDDADGIPDNDNDAFHTRTEAGEIITDFNDNTMDGMIYSNIGDVISTRNIYSGALNSDYNEATGNRYATVDVRYSGNDITEKKSQEIIDFASSGFPVIISEDLVGAGAAEYTPLPLTIIIDSTALPNGEVELSLTDTVIDALYSHDLATYSFKWFSRDTSTGTATEIVGSNGVNLVVDKAGYYYCEVTIDYTNGVGVNTNNSANSNTIHLDSYSSLNRSTGTSTLNGHTNQSTYYPVTISYSDHTVYTHLNFDTTGTTVSYQWYKQETSVSGWDSWETIGTSSSSFLRNGPYNINERDRFYCDVTVTSGGETRVYTTFQIELHYNTSNRYDYTDDIVDSSKIPTQYIATMGSTNYFYLDGSVNTTLTNTPIALNDPTVTAGTTVSFTPNNLNVTPNYNYTWYTKASDSTAFPSTTGTATGTDNTFTIPVDKTMDIGVLVNLTSVGSPEGASIFTSNYFQLVNHLLSDSDDGGQQNLTFPTFDATAFSIREDRVDNSSIMYETLNKIMALPNVMSDVIASSNTDDVLQYLNLSKPSLNIIASPTEYTETGLGDDLLTDAANTLSYTFTISNATDPTPSSTRYQVNLYIDQNGDGRYETSEHINALTVTGPGNVSVAENNLAADTQYTVTRSLPDEYVGVIPWKLEVVKVGNTAATASQTGFTFNKSDTPVVISLLQIIGSDFGRGDPLVDWYDDSNNLIHEGVDKFEVLFKQLKDEGLYDINVETRTIAQINALGYDRAGYLSEFNKYNMVMLGFTETFGAATLDGRGLNANSALAITDYIDSGKAILFTHDTTSPYNNSSAWGYTSNMILRDSLKLDRYGVTNSTYGVTDFSPLFNTIKDPINGELINYVANGYKYADSTILNSLDEEGYSIAYAPGTNRTETVLNNSGQASHAITRSMPGDITSDYPTHQFSTNGNPSGGNYDNVPDYPVKGGLANTYNITQVNKGQITSFPYNVNTTEFNGSLSEFSVAQTHQQWFQLNMNSDDIVVWYSLADNTRSDYFRNHYNDVVNTYYIYNAGNITYSGAGHAVTSGTNVSDDEAKLFVNTMVAAYRATVASVSIEFNDGRQVLSSTFVPTQFNQNSLTGTILDLDTSSSSSGHPVPFKIIDPNLSQNQLDVALYYLDPDGDYTIDGSGEMIAVASGTPSGSNRYSRVSQAELNITDADGNKVNDLRSNVIYNLHLTDDMTNYFETLNENSLELRLEISINIAGENFKNLSSALNLVKLGLLNLN